MLTTGFDAPNIDCVAILRPTMSPGLFYQMVGRGFRLHPGKKNCLVLDFGGNVLRHGPVDQMHVRETAGGGKGGDAPAKECPECQSLIAAGYARCPDCGYEFPKPERANHDAQASTESVLSGEVSDAPSHFGFAEVVRRRAARWPWGDGDAPSHFGFAEVVRRRAARWPVSRRNEWLACSLPGQRAATRGHTVAHGRPAIMADACILMYF